MKRFLLVLLLIAGCLHMRAQVPYPTTHTPAGPIVKAEYFFDKDPGVGMGSTIDIPATSNLQNFTQALPLDGAALTNGIHRLYIRSMDASGQWSLTHSSVFDNLVVRPYGETTPAPDIVELEYFIDSDPGVGNGSKIDITLATNTGALTAAINITGLNPGVHRLHIRSKNASGKWSLTNLTLFDNTALPPYPVAEAPALPISQLEYFIDNDPGIGMGTPIPAVAAVDLASVSVSIPVAHLDVGTHTLYIRSKAAAWSHIVYADFSVDGALPLSWQFVEGKVQEQKALLSWGTAQEVNTDLFVIEHSTDGSRFSAIGEVKSSGNSNTASYRFVHPKMEEGFNYYRIKQLDKDEKFTYSKVIVLLYNTTLKSIVVGPNPAQNSINVVLPKDGTLQRVEIYSSAGVKVKEQIVTGKGSTIQINLQGLASGVYMLRLTGKQHVETRMFIKN